MSRVHILETDRTYFSKWHKDDLDLAILLWSNSDVCRYICKSGVFSRQEIINRLDLEINNDIKYNIQYWPIFNINNDEFMGCCGLRINNNKYEIGFHLLPNYWHQNYAYECANKVIDYAFNKLDIDLLIAGHNPNNLASKKVLTRLGFKYIKDEYYKPTKLFHATYELRREY